MKRTLMVLIASLALAGCGDSFEEGYEDGKDAATEVVEESPKDEVVEDEVEEVVEEVEEAEVELEEEAVVEHVSDTETKEVGREARVELALMVIDDTMSSVGVIHYNEADDIIEITPTDPAFTDELFLVVAGVASSESWDGMVESFKGLSESLTLLVDEDISLGLLNPENESRYILVINDGYVLYNVMDE